MVGIVRVDWHFLPKQLHPPTSFIAIRTYLPRLVVSTVAASGRACTAVLQILGACRTPYIQAARVPPAPQPHDPLSGEGNCLKLYTAWSRAFVLLFRLMAS